MKNWFAQPVLLIYASAAMAIGVTLSPADSLKIYALETELYHARVKAEKKALLKELIVQEAKKTGVSPEAWEQEFKARNAVNFDDEKLRSLVKKGEEAEYNAVRDLFLREYEDALMDKLWEDLSRRYGVKISAKPPKIPQIALETKGFFTSGPEDAKIEIIEFFDLECPYCRKAESYHTKLRQTFANRLRWISIDFPAEKIHPAALNAHIALQCAGKQDRFFEFREKIMKSGEGLKEVLFRPLAREISLDMTAFDGCLRDQKEAITAEIRRGIAYGKSLGIPGTPTLFINRRPYPGLRNYAQLRKIIAEVSR